MFTCDNTMEICDWSAFGVIFKGFSNMEENFVWQTGAFGEIIFDFMDQVGGDATEIDVVFDLDVFKSGEALPGQNVFFYMNGLRVGSFYIKYRRTVICRIAPGLLRTKGNILTIDTPNAKSPLAMGGEDRRVLGVQLFAMQFRRAA